MPFRRGHLRYFVAVAEEGQMTRAAAKLHMAQPALSQAISQLESELGLQLLERHPRGVTLTAAGETFLEKARQALAAETDAAQTAESLARSAQGSIEFGFIAIPPGLTHPDLLAAFAETHPDIELRFREIQPPSGPTALWLGEVDVALCSQPLADPDVWVQAFRAHPRVVLAAASHPLAKRRELTVAEVLDETFIAMDPRFEPTWAGFWSLDDHRGEPPPHQATDRAGTMQERFAMIAAGRGITTVPACHAEVIAKLVSNVVAIPLCDADPTILSLVGREDHRNPLVEALRAVARNLAEDAADGPLPASA